MLQRRSSLGRGRLHTVVRSERTLRLDALEQRHSGPSTFAWGGKGEPKFALISRCRALEIATLDQLLHIAESASSLPQNMRGLFQHLFFDASELLHTRLRRNCLHRAYSRLRQQSRSGERIMWLWTNQAWCWRHKLQCLPGHRATGPPSLRAATAAHLITLPCRFRRGLRTRSLRIGFTSLGCGGRFPLRLPLPT